MKKKGLIKKFPLLGNTISAKEIEYLLRDEFITDLAAGSVNGTPAEPGPGTRVVTDTDNKLSIVAGECHQEAHTVVALGDPGLWYGAIARTAGRIYLTKVNLTGRGGQFGFDVNQVLDLAGENYFFFNAIATFAVRDAIAPFNISCGSHVLGTDYQLAVVLRAAGGFYFIKGGAYTTWTLLWSATVRNTATVYPAAEVGKIALGEVDIDYIRIPDELWLPVPLLSDSFNRANGVLDITDGAGHAEANGGGGKVWQFDAGIWTIAGNKAVGSPVAGAEKVTSGDFEGSYTGGLHDDWTQQGPGTPSEETVSMHGGASAQKTAASAANQGVYQTVQTVVGTWYLVNGWVKSDGTNINNFMFRSGNDPGSGTLIYIKGVTSAAWTECVGTGRGLAASTNLISRTQTEQAYDIWVDDVSVKPLTLSELLSTVDIGQQNVIADVDLVIAVGTQAGLVLNLDDKDTPANFVVAYHDGINAVLLKCVAGTYTFVISAAAAYSANATLRVIKDGTSYSLYYNNEKIGATETISDAGIIDNTRHGMFNTYDGNTLDNCVIWSRKTGYNKLGRF